jgi:hypothetical protein
MLFEAELYALWRGGALQKDVPMLVLFVQN